MAKSQKNQTFVLKIKTEFLAQHNWHLDLNLSEEQRKGQMIVSLGSSQVLRWLIQMQGRQNDDLKATNIKKEIKSLKKQENTIENKERIKILYDILYKTQFQQDYMMLIMDSEEDYRRALQGYSITVDGVTVTYKRLLGTAGSIKKSTIIFVNENIYPELMQRINNGRNMQKEFVAAKLNTYMALTCSTSISVSWPRIIVVDDAITHFKSDVLLVDDSNDDIEEPNVTFVSNYEVKYNVSDGMGFIDPEFSAIWARELNEGDEPLSGYNTRCAFLKGMLFTVPFKQFAKEIAHTYKIIDAYGMERDIRDADAIVTVSMLKLWDSYPNYEAYYENCMKNNYDFAIAKSSPHQLRNIHTTNYQQLQDYTFTDEQIDTLSKPTVQNIQDCLGLDWRKLILYMCGKNLDDSNVEYAEPMCKAIMANPVLINDPYVRSKVSRMINKRINQTKIGVLDIEGDYAILGNDPYSLLQNIFQIPITGLLKAGECYHQYWSDLDAKEIILFRAPMTSHNNVCKLKVVATEEMKKWYRYIKTCCLFNSWDTTANRLNGCDYDSDTAECTNNQILLDAYIHRPTLMCVQRKADECIPTEEDFVASELQGFGDTIGAVTNRATNMISLRDSFDSESEEYKILSYRINTMMNYQQNAIDRIKGVIARPIPSWWLYRSLNNSKDKDNEEVKRQKSIYKTVAAELKPWFFIYRYSTEKNNLDTYNKKILSNCKIRFGKSFKELQESHSLTEEENNFLMSYETRMPVSRSPGVMNRLCWKMEESFKTTNVFPNVEFDRRILKNSSIYTQEEYDEIQKLYEEYNDNMQLFLKNKYQNEHSDKKIQSEILDIKQTFIRECQKICPNAEILSNIVIDLCYTSNTNKTFAWDVAGEQIYLNVLHNNGDKITFPIKDVNGDIDFYGVKFSLHTKLIGGDDDADFK